MGLVSRYTSATSASTFYTFDAQGNVLGRYNSGGAGLAGDLFDAFGSHLSTVGTEPPADPWGFGAQAGYYTDAETGLFSARTVTTIPRKAGS